MPAYLRRICLALVLAAVALITVGAVITHRNADARRHYLGTGGWPASGQAAYVIGTEAPEIGPGQHAAPIASLAKVMTAYLVLKAAPLTPDSDGFTLQVTAGDVADTARRAGRDESILALARGEVLTERQALTALLLPSANNVAIMLARRVGGSVPAFVARMNTAAAGLGMVGTRYTDPSGFRATTVSTASDQLRLAGAAMRLPVFAAIVDQRSARLPVAGDVRNTDQLLGQDGFVGIKTGSTDEAGGCFMFRARRIVGVRLVEITGVVLGQPGHNLVVTGQYAARQLVDHIYQQRFSPGDVKNPVGK
ncbi:MAG TPA: hypothetical protein VGH30_09795 [Jatrophihabitantaceae bacterium]